MAENLVLVFIVCIQNHARSAFLEEGSPSLGISEPRALATSETRALEMGGIRASNGRKKGSGPYRGYSKPLKSRFTRVREGEAKTKYFAYSLSGVHPKTEPSRLEKKFWSLLRVLQTT